MRKGDLAAPQFCSAWVCGAVPGKVIRQAGTDPLTGDLVPALVVRVRCKDRNPSGECSDFDTAPAPGFQPHSTTEGRSDTKVEITALSLVFIFVAGAIFGAFGVSLYDRSEEGMLRRSDR